MMLATCATRKEAPIGLFLLVSRWPRWRALSLMIFGLSSLAVEATDSGSFSGGFSSGGGFSGGGGSFG